MHLFKKIAALMGALATIVTFAIVSTLPAEAYPPESFSEFCNSAYSDDVVIAYRGPYSDPSKTWWTDTDQCWFDGVPSAVGPVTDIRVDVDPAGFGADIDSYKIGEIGVGWGPCHDGETNSSNPPDSYGANGVRYRNYSNSGC